MSRMGAAGEQFLAKYVDYVMAGGPGVEAIVTRLERLKFETIVTGKTTREVLSEWQSGSHPQ